MTSVHSKNLPVLTEVHLGINGLALLCQKGAMWEKDKEESIGRKTCWQFFNSSNPGRERKLILYSSYPLWDNKLYTPSIYFKWISIFCGSVHIRDHLSPFCDACDLLEWIEYSVDCFSVSLHPFPYTTSLWLVWAFLKHGCLRIVRLLP